jgi:hypothetical protein
MQDASCMREKLGWVSSKKIDVNGGRRDGCFGLRLVHLEECHAAA